MLVDADRSPVLVDADWSPVLVDADWSPVLFSPVAAEHFATTQSIARFVKSPSESSALIVIFADASLFPCLSVAPPCVTSAKRDEGG